MRSSSSAEKEFADALAVARVIGRSSSAGLIPGSIVHGSYEVVRRLAAGSMGTVYLCRHTKLANRQIAVKILSAEVAADRVARDRLADEISNTYDVSHPNVIRTYEYFEDGAVCGFSMEYADGGDLLSLSERQGPLPFNVALHFLKQMCSGVAAIHDSGIVHRDIKPENMLLTRDRQIKVSDFGIAYSKARSRKALAGNVEGAVDYLSPEYVENGTFDERSDIFALGMVAFRLIAGRTPTESSDVFEALQLRVSQDLPAVSSYRPDCPVFLVEFVRKCLQRDPELRFQHVSEMLAALNSATQAHGDKPSQHHKTPVTVVPAKIKEQKQASSKSPGLFSRLIVTLAVTAGVLRLVYLDSPELPTLADLQAPQSLPVVQQLESKPAPVAPRGINHVVRAKGETVAIIAYWYTGSVDNWREIEKANPLVNVNRIELDQEIFIPAELIKEWRPLREKEVKQVIAALKARRALNASTIK